jgi:hypothetical protein
MEKSRHPRKRLAAERSDITRESKNCNPEQRSILLKNGSLRLNREGSVSLYSALRRRCI